MIRTVAELNGQYFMHGHGSSKHYQVKDQGSYKAVIGCMDTLNSHAVQLEGTDTDNHEIQWRKMYKIKGRS